MGLLSFLRRPAPPAPDAAWWREADALAAAPDRAALDRLRRAAAALPGAPEDRERHREMLEAIDALLAIAAAPLPHVETQHRVIGDDVCHAVAAATVGDDVPAPAKLFVTSARVLLVAGGVKAWPWHRVRAVRRADRTVTFSLAGGEPVDVRLNTYADAVAVAHLAGRLIAK